jgi:hypothetical protein
MNLERHIRVLWRHRFVTIGGLLLGLVLALLAAFKVGPGGLERRGVEQWSSSSQIFVTQKGFPWGRVTLPAAAAPGADPAVAAGTSNGNETIPYADPGRFTNLALLYSVISYSDTVRSQLPGHPAPEQIQATAFDPTGRGDNFLPIITLVTNADTPEAAVKLNQATFEGLKKVLVAEQKKSNIPEKDRVLLSVLSKPSAPLLVAGRSKMTSILALMLAVIATLAFVHILEAIRLSRTRREGGTGELRAVPGEADAPQPEYVGGYGAHQRQATQSAASASNGRGGPVQPPAPHSGSGGLLGR